MGKQQKTVKMKQENDENRPYYDGVITQFDGIIERFKAKPFLLLLFNGMCGLLYLMCYGIGMDRMGKSGFFAYITGVLFVCSVCLCLMSMIAVLFKKGETLYPIALSAVLNVFCFIWNMIALVMAIRDCFDWIEAIPVMIFFVLSIAYLIYTIVEMRKEIGGAEPKLPLWVRVPMWVIWVVLFLVFSITFFYGKRTGPTFLGKMAPDSLFSWYWAFYSLLLNYCMTRLNLNSVIYCWLKIQKKL